MNGSMSSPKATDKSQDPARSRKLIRKPQDYSKVLDKNDRSKAIMRGYDIDSDLNESKIDGDREGNDANQDSSDDGDLELYLSEEELIDAVLVQEQGIENTELSSSPSPKTTLPSQASLLSSNPNGPSSSNSNSSTLSTSSSNLIPLRNRSIRRLSNYASSKNELTGKDRHYINKALVCLEITREFSQLSTVGGLSYYGRPFLPHPNGPNSRPRTLINESRGMLSWISRSKVPETKVGWEDYEWKREEENGSPILSFLFERFVKTLPALRMAKDEYWTDQIQPFIDSFAERDLSTSQERDEITKRHLLSLGISKLVSDFYSTVITADGNSEPARPNREIMNRVDNLFPGSMEGMWKRDFEAKIGYNAWTAVVERSIVKEETTYSILSQVLVGKSHPRYLVKRTFSQSLKLFSSIHQLDPTNQFELPFTSLTFDSSLETIQFRLRSLIIALSTPSTELISSSKLSEARVLLESYLLKVDEKISEKELDVMFEKAEIVEVKAERDHLQWIKFGKKAKELRSTWNTYKNALIAGDEIDRSIALVKKTPKIVDLPESYQLAEKRACIWVAYAAHYIFVESANGPELLHILKSLHDLTPYAAMKLGLSLVNPTVAIKAIVALVLGQPGGTPSLFQRIFSIIIGGGIKHQKKIIHRLRKEFDHDSVYVALNSYVYSTFTDRAEVREEANTKEEDILLTIIRKHGSLLDITLVQSWYEAFCQQHTFDSSPRLRDTQPSSQIKLLASRFSTSKELLRAILKKRDREQVLEIIMEPNTPILIRSTLTVFYESIYKIADSTKLADRLGDYQLFIDDLLKVCSSDSKEPSDFILLISRHSQSLYYWIHEMAFNGGTLLQPAIDWCKVALGHIRDGIPTTTAGSTSKSKSSFFTSNLNSSTIDKNGEERATIPIDSLLASSKKDDTSITKEEQEVERESILKECKYLSNYILYSKVEGDINLRLDLIAVSAATSSINSSSPIKSSKHSHVKKHSTIPIKSEVEDVLKISAEDRSKLLQRVILEDPTYLPSPPSSSSLSTIAIPAQSSKLSWAYFASPQILKLSNNIIDAEGRQIPTSSTSSTITSTSSTLSAEEGYTMSIPRLGSIRTLRKKFEKISRDLLGRGIFSSDGGGEEEEEGEKENEDVD